MHTGRVILNLVFLLLQLAGWAITVAGLGKLTDSCNQKAEDINLVPAGIFGLGANRFSEFFDRDAADIYDCGVQYSFYWWVISLHLACIVAGVLGQFAQWAANGKVAIVGLYTIVSALYCVYVYPMIMAAYVYKDDTSNVWGIGYKLAASGAIAAQIFNFLFILVFGHIEDIPALHKQVKGGQPAGFTAA
mmetsp:Transcript_11130/g.23994  ORF Transcript_11130/g.23994 Transcript_11130/m.23994 type:complete len:190 (-) Transcript_11130:791-1360(-)